MFKNVNKPVTFLAISLLCLVSGIIIAFPNASAKAMADFYAFTSTDFAWLFMGLAMALTGFALFICFSKYGDIKLGGPGAKPHYSNFTWFSMNVCACLAVGVLTFGMVEWSNYITQTPFGIEPGSTTAYEMATAYGFFHWGPVAWSFYIIPAAAVGYMYWNKKAPSLAPSDLCSGVLTSDRNKHKGFRLFIDGVVAFCFVGSVASTIGLGVPIIGELMQSVFGVPNGFTTQLCVLLAFGVFFLAAASKRIAKGMAFISDNNVRLAGIFFLFVFLCSDKSFLLNNFFMGVGLDLQNFFRMGFYTDSIAQTGFIQSWTVFYWGWYLSVAFSCGVWIARTSYGRTLKQIIGVTMGLTAFASWITYGVLGSYGMSLELDGILNTSSVIGEVGMAGAITAILETLPIPKVVCFVFIMLIFFNLATTVTAHATNTAILTSKDMSGDSEPTSTIKVIWGLLFLLIPVGVLILEHNVPGLNILNTLQSLTVAFGIPIIALCAFMGYSAFKVFKQDVTNGNIPVEPEKLYKWQH